MPIPGRPDLDDFVVNSARDRGLPIVIATLPELLSIANGDPMVLGTVDGTTEVCVKLASVEELRDGITRAQAAMPYPPVPPTEQQLAELAQPLNEALRSARPPLF